MKTNLLTLTVLLFLGAGISQAQITKKDVKHFNKSIKHYNKAKYEKAFELIDPIVLRNPNNATLWAYKIEYMYRDYMVASSKGRYVIVTSTGDLGSAKMLQDLLNAA